MLPIWPNTNRIPVWVWLLGIAAFFGIGLVASDPEFDADAAMDRVRQGIALAVLLLGAFWALRGTLVLLRVRALDARGEVVEGRLTRRWSSSQRVRGNESFNTSTRWVTQHFLAYRFEHPGGESRCRRMSVDAELWESLRDNGPLAIRYLPGRASVNRPEALAMKQVLVMRWLQLLAGVGLAGWSAIDLAPGTLW